jgi:hypothetical protein
MIDPSDSKEQSSFAHAKMKPCSQAECAFDKALINELTERVARLEAVILAIHGKDILQLVNTWPIKEVKDGTQQ